ncbi:MAG: M48 family metallopeptidase [Dehalococcoidia bacterium]
MVKKRRITLDGRTVWYAVRRSSRAMHVRLEIKQGTGLTVVIPKSCKVGQIPAFLKAKKRWILENLVKFGTDQTLSLERDLTTGDVVPYLGRNLEVVRHDNHGGDENVRREGNRLLVSLKSPSARVNLAVERWYRTEARKLIEERVDKFSARLGVNCGRITIRGQKTRWGSCSQKGNLNFNWRLVMAPEPVIDYVVIHELAHLKEMNHSKKFWELVGKHCPRWREHKKWLKDHESELAARLRM